ncbi:MAG: hypothetical protein Q8R00_03535 [Candidatus Nanoarchaeia archaeon]|nr:hypothetical protein [Candidatus Nanoarchaeia archaeon]
MADLSNATIMCEKCNLKTDKGYIVKEGYKIRSWNCSKCNTRYEHPGDLQELRNFRELKKKEFNVKLRLVGNSYAISIPREIIEFHETMEREFDKMVRLAFEEPDRLSLFFSRSKR